MLQGDVEFTMISCISETPNASPGVITIVELRAMVHKIHSVPRLATAILVVGSLTNKRLQSVASEHSSKEQNVQDLILTACRVLSERTMVLVLQAQPGFQEALTCHVPWALNAQPS